MEPEVKALGLSCDLKRIPFPLSLCFPCVKWEESVDEGMSKFPSDVRVSDYDC